MNHMFIFPLFWLQRDLVSSSAFKRRSRDHVMGHKQNINKAESQDLIP